MKDRELVLIVFLFVFSGTLAGYKAGRMIERLNVSVVQIEKVEHWKTRYDICAKQFLGDIADMKDALGQK